MQPREALEQYLRHLREIQATGAGVKEQSFYGPLERLLDEIGGELTPRVRCVGQLSNTGAGEPDYGLFTQEQFQPGEEKPLPGQQPARGVVEVKAPDEELDDTVAGEQVARYLRGYGLVLVTNFREFRLVGLADGRPVTVEQHVLAPDAAAFWTLTAHPRKAATEQGEAFYEFLQRALLYNAPLSAPKDVAWFLASYAREARARVEGTNVPALDAVRQALEEALGMTFQGEKGRHFFRSTLVQTLFYGLFAAWVLWHQRGRAGRFDWRAAGWELHVPMIQSLYAQLAQPDRLRPLGLVEILERAAALLGRVDADAFFAQFSQEDAIQYFYEPFLQAFDPELRKELGVWYTPPEIVRYMVARVDTVLREELGIADGLGNPNVVVLDPCCGTGAFLVEVLRRIKENLDAKGMGAMSELKLKEAAMRRIFGFEILPAPFVVAHLQLGLLLHTLGDELTSADERVGVFLTNALTGWEPPTEEIKQRLHQLSLFSPEMRGEVDAATRVKQSEKILVIIGNPPYNGFAGVAVEEERDLTNAYRDTRRAPKPQGQGLNDLYVRFYRMAERQIVERTHRGVVCFISNYSWLDGLSFTGMRERYLAAFSTVWIDNLNGDKYKTGKVTPAGEPDPSIFSTEQNREGIQVGTAIGLLVRAGQPQGDSAVRFRHLWGRRKREELLESLEARSFAEQYEVVTPAVALGLPFTPAQVSAAYLSWPLLTELFPTWFPGVKTSRDEMLVDIDRTRLEARIQEIIAAKSLTYNPEKIIRFAYRPFDQRWLYWESEEKLLDRPRKEYLRHVFKGNVGFVTQQKPRRDWSPPQIIANIGCLDLMDRGASIFPLYLRNGHQAEFFSTENGKKLKYNLTETAQVYLVALAAEPTDLFFHTLAMLHAPCYRIENAGALRQDWPRIPLPSTADVLHAAALLGHRVAALLDPETPLDSVISGQLRAVGPIARKDGDSLRAADLAITAGWGHAGQGGVTMPARGKAVERDYTDEERAALGKAAGLLGDTTFDIYLNDVACWRNVPSRVWSYTLGGYQVLKKWLSYREQPLLGRPLLLDEVADFTDTVRRIAALLLLEPELDGIYRRVQDDSRSLAKPGDG